MKLRFTIRDLLWLIVVAAVIVTLVLRYVRTERAFADAKLHYDAVVAKHEVGLSSMMEPCGESIALYFAERERWFHSSDALKNHIKRLR